MRIPAVLLDRAAVLRGIHVLEVSLADSVQVPLLLLAVLERRFLTRFALGSPLLHLNFALLQCLDKETLLQSVQLIFDAFILPLPILDGLAEGVLAVWAVRYEVKLTKIIW